MIEFGNLVSNLQRSLTLFIPELILVGTLLVMILTDLIFKRFRFVNAFVSLVGFILAGVFLFLQPRNSFAFLNSFVVDDFSFFIKIIILISNILIVLMSFESKELIEKGRNLGEFYTFLVGMTFGMFLVSGATNLILIYLAIETMSISSYILAGYTKEIKRASEASLKYVIFGAVSSGLMIYGISLLFGLTGSLNLIEIRDFLATNKVDSLAFFVSAMLVLAGFAYKISAVPFHFWTPDVYEGAPITITAYLSVASKAAGFAILIRFIKSALSVPTETLDSIWTMVGNVDWSLIIAVLSALTMTLGNIVALWQNNLKRLLAYSSIAHAGYILMGVATLNETGTAAVLVYFFMYLLMNIGAFICVMLISNEIGSEDIKDFEGLGYRAPLLSAVFSVLLFSLIGLPPTAGFIAKFYIFAAAIDANLIWLAVIGVINSVISLYYYVKIMRNMFIRGLDVDSPAIKTAKLNQVVVILLAALTILFGVYFSPIINWANASASIYIIK
ncbi:NADH-quinone oxidoreductase subunit N [Bacteroidetes/Chlorobi group bacterium Naka2016]|jgi:NADH-quinone oxidoreductase subunit N|nr:MAG: NADH-quinone oxidoreductase subunit N [Bacteroidetes/Chlorobi group bacterium Naka2016]